MDRTLMEELAPGNDDKNWRGKQGRLISEIVMESGEEEEDGITSSNSSNGFDCNICLEIVQDPVVTLCGHLYCWPCIYRWLNSGNDDDEEEDYYSDLPSHRHCPVCKSEISESAVVPLFSHGQTSAGNDVAEKSATVPRRPPPRRIIHRREPAPRRRRYEIENPMMRSSGVGLELSGRVPIPVVGMLGEIVFAGSFGDYTAPYYQMGAGGGGSTRVRRQMMAADKSLSRVCFFLVCCVVMCIVLF
ncbi:E3 ubiquitin-protein ligase RMA1H1 [Linum perenne]